MSWITVIWSMNAGASLTLAAFHGMGLRIMRYRAQCIGSSCEVHAGPTQGTIVHCRVPLEAQHSVSTIS
jgi:signal transduction histidine kinase